MPCRPSVFLLVIVAVLLAPSVNSFQSPRPSVISASSFLTRSTTQLWEGTDKVVELADDDEEEVAAPTEDAPVAPFLSQGEISEEAMAMDLSDPKQARVMFYIILSLLPVLFLIPLMLGSRELIPAEILPPVEIS